MKLSTGLYPILALSLFCLNGCRSDADRMAEFCLNYDRAVKESGDCSDMARRMNELLAPPQPGIRDRDVCANGTTACLPCRSAAREMLKRCGYDEAMKPVLEQMHFSRQLRSFAQEQAEE